MEALWTQILATSGLEWLGTLTGIMGVYLSIKEKAVAWPLFIICYGCYVFLSFEAGLFAALFMNLVFIGLSIYGWWRWTRKAATDTGARLITRTPRFDWWATGIFWVLATLCIGYALSRYTEAYRPYLDAFATSGAFAAQWMLGRKQIGTWLCWLISDTIFIGLWFAQGYLLTLVLYTVFIILAIIGWRQWHLIVTERESSAQADPPITEYPL
jgi:nicotinamide mononucleotide transporter